MGRKSILFSITTKQNVCGTGGCGGSGSPPGEERSNMARFQIVSDSSCDLGRERAKELGVALVSFYVSFDGENYYR